MVAAALYLIGTLFVQAGNALTPFIFGVVIAYLVLPIVNRLSTLMPRWGAILLVYLVGIALTVLSFTFLIPPLLEQTRNAFVQIRLPSLLELEAQALAFFELYSQYIPPEFQREIETTLNNVLNTIQNNLTSLVQQGGGFLFTQVQQVFNTLAFLLGFIIIPFWLFYVLYDQQAGLDGLNGLIHPAARKDFWAILTITDRIFSNYIRGQLFLGFVVGLASFVGLTVLNMFGFEIPYTLLLAVIAGFTELIPLIGPVLGAIPAVIVALLSDSPTAALAVLALYVVIQQLEAQLLIPRIIGESVGIHPAVLMVVLVIAGQSAGLLGVILAAPLAAIARDIFRYIYGRLGDPPLPAGQLPEGYEDQPSATVMVIECEVTRDAQKQSSPEA
ncbi:MAG: AI-2E family transporter [Cyanobacteria bacterium M5B4]|nr:MAG: AI-2E family transporter [Cyanobacteria bacterium M5B4]